MGVGRGARGVLVRRAWRGASGRPAAAAVRDGVAGEGDVRGRGGVRPVRPRSGRAARRAVPLSRHRLPQRPVRGRAVRGRSPRRRVCAQAGRVGRSVVVLRCEHARRALGRCARDARRARTGLRFRTFAGVARPASVLARETRGGVARSRLPRAGLRGAPLLIGRDGGGRALCSAPTRRFAARFGGSTSGLRCRAQGGARQERAVLRADDGRVGARAMPRKAERAAARRQARRVAARGRGHRGCGRSAP